jgi:MFS family permease
MQSPHTHRFKHHPALQHRDFNLLALGRLCGTFGSQMLSVAVGWQVYDITHDPFALGMVGLCQFLPALFLVLHAGHFADQLDRARLAAITYMVHSSCGLALFLLSWHGNHEVWPIYSLAVMLGVARITGAPASKALLPNLIPAEAFSNAVSLSTLAFQIATIGGPALGGIAYAFGAPTVYGIATLMMGLATLSTALIRTRSQGEKKPLNWDNLIAGAHFIRQHPIVLGAISLDLFAVLFGGVIALLPIYAKDILHVGPAGLGILRAAPAAGAAIMAVVLAYIPLKRRVGHWLFGSVILFGLTVICFGLSGNFFLSLGLLLTMGASDMISVYVRSHLVQMQTPDEVRGRVSAVNMLFITTSNELGEFESGVTASWFGTIPATILGGVLTLAVAGLCAWRIPALRRVDQLKVAED